MPRLPDFEAWAVFAKVAELGAFARAADELSLSKATVSKAVSRLEARLGTALFHRTSRRLSLTEAGRVSLIRAAVILAEGEAVEAEAAEQASAPRGLVRVAAPLSFGVRHLGPVLPNFFAEQPGVTVELSLSDRKVDLVADGFDLALRIAALSDSTLLARRLCEVRLLLVGAPAYFARHGRPKNPDDLRGHRGLAYTGGPSRELWSFTHHEHGHMAVPVPGPLRADNADVLEPAVRAGLGLALQPEFICWRDVREGVLEPVMTDWVPPGIALHLITPPSPLRPARVRALMDFLARRFREPPWAQT